MTIEATVPDLGTTLAAGTADAAYRVVQESLTNAVRHGRANTVHVLLHRMESRVLVVVEDDGVGFDSSAWRAAWCRRG